MLLLDRQQVADSQGGKTPPGVEALHSLGLRWREDGKIVDLPRGKTTIGSSPRCNVRIQQPGVQPLHCLILNDAQGLSVRRWAGETFLNGRLLEESPLGPGDCLKVGPVELEVVAPQTAAQPTPPMTTPVADSQATGELLAGRDAARKRGRQLLGALRRDREAHRELSQRVAELQQQFERAIAERQSVAGELQKANVELAETRQRATDQKTLAVAGQELADQNEQLLLEVGELNQTVDRLTRQQAASEAAFQALAEKEAALADEVRRLGEAKSRLQQERAELTSQQAAVCGERDAALRKYELLHADVQAITAEKSNLADERSVACREREELRLHNEQLQKELHALSEQNSALDTEQVFLSSERDELRGQNDRLEANIQVLAQEKDKLAEGQAAVCGERDELRGQNDRLQADMRALAEEKNSLASERAVLWGDRDGFRRQCERLQHDLNVLAGDKAALAEEKAALCDQRDELRRQNEELQEDVHELVEEKTALSNEHAVLSAERDELCGERDELCEQKKHLQHELHGLAGEKAALVDESTKVFSERDELRRQIERLQANVHELAEEKSALANERAVLCGERDGFRRQFERLEDELRVGNAEKAALVNQSAGVCGERDALRRQAERLQADLNALSEQKKSLATEQELVCEERDELRRQVEELQSNVHALAEEKSSLSEQKAAIADDRAALASERDRLLLETSRIEELEQQVREAVTDRENTSSELYRALLQLAEMQERDEHHGALETAHRALNAELEKSATEVARLQEQIDRLAEQQAEADGARQVLTLQTTELNEAQQRLANENADLLTSLGETRQQLEMALRQQAEYQAGLQSAEAMQDELAALQEKLEEARRNEAALTEVAARFEGELISKRQAEDQVASMVANYERQNDDNARQLAEFAEMVARLESELAEAEKRGSDFEKSRGEWESRYSNAKRQEADQSQRIAELEAELADAQAAAAASRAENESYAAERAAATESGSAAAPPIMAPSTEFDWTTSRGESRPVGWLQSESEANALEKTTTPERATDSSLWGQTGLAQEPSFGSASSADDGRDSWSQTAESLAANDADPVCEEEPSFESQSTSVRLTPRESSILELKASPVLPADEPRERQPAAEASRESQPISFIERYSSMFAEEESRGGEANETTPPEPTRDQRLAEPVSPQQPLSMSSVRPSQVSPASSAGDDEESIEQYMAKLLQRVRGDSQASPTAPVQLQRGTTNSGPLGYNPTTPFPGMPMTARDPVAPKGGELDQTAATESGRRKTSVPAPQTDLEALRALANETARRAISRHALRKHRRNAITKVIVSALAGVTSLWMMLEAPSWRTLQFITACVAMLVAANWAGETFRTMLESFRVGEEEESEEMDEFTAQLHAPLPIDIENVGRWDRQEPRVESQESEAPAASTDE